MNQIICLGEKETTTYNKWENNSSSRAALFLVYKSLPFTLNTGDSTLKQPLHTINKPVVCSFSYTGHVRGKQGTSSWFFSILFASLFCFGKCVPHIFVPCFSHISLRLLKWLSKAVTKLPHPEKLDMIHKKFMSAQAGWGQWSSSKSLVQRVKIGQNEMYKGGWGWKCVFILLLFSRLQWESSQWTLELISE